MSHLLASLLQVESSESPPVALQSRRSRNRTRRTFRGEGRTNWEASYPKPPETSLSDDQEAAGIDSGETIGETIGCTVDRIGQTDKDASGRGKG